MRFRSRSAKDTRRAARQLGEAALAVMATGGRAPAEAEAIVVALVGPLGAGKTEWAKGLAEGLGIDPRLVASPTFVIASELPGGSGGPRLAHVDLYRLESEAELEATAFVDLLAPGTVVAVEWGDRFPRALPSDRVEVRLAPVPDVPEARDIELRATGPRAWQVVGQWAQRRSGGHDREEQAAWR